MPNRKATLFVVIDTETNALVNPDKLWVVVCKELVSGKLHIFRNLHENKDERTRFFRFGNDVSCWIGHNFISYDLDVLSSIGQYSINPKEVIDTLVVSRLLNYSQEGGHSLEAIGSRMGYPKGTHSDWSQWSQEMEDYCIRDVEVTYKYYKEIEPFIHSPQWRDSLRLEHDSAILCKKMHDNGFHFNIDGAKDLHQKILQRLEILDKEILQAFPPKARFIKEITPRATSKGTLHQGDFRWIASGDLSPFMAGCPFSRVKFEPFNPGSPRQIVERLNEAGWNPTEKTKGHIQAEREDDLQRLEHFRTYGWKVSEENLSTLPSIEELEKWNNLCLIKIQNKEKLIKELTTKKILNTKELKPEGTTIKIQKLLEIDSLKESMDSLVKTLVEWQVNNTIAVKFVENNFLLWSIIVTPQDVYVDCSAIIATQTWDGLRNTEFQLKSISTNHAARKLVQRLLLDSRRSTLEEWFNAYNPIDNRIHPNFLHIGAWTHRKSHNGPNCANIPSTPQAPKGREPTEVERISLEINPLMRSFWDVTPGNWLVGVDADGIQLRILAHYMDDPVFTEGLINGRKEDGTDAHSLNAKALGKACKSRDVSKTFIYAWLLGAGTGKVSEILECSRREAKEATNQFINVYPGLRRLKEEIIPRDAARGYFEGLDGRYILCDSEHLMLAGYLQAGESIVMKHACRLWTTQLLKENIHNWLLVNDVHDEWQTEVKGDYALAEYIAKVQADSIRQAGINLGVKCPLAGSWLNSHGKPSIGKNWSETH